jgi:hypothetical protein
VITTIQRIAHVHKELNKLATEGSR